MNLTNNCNRSSSTSAFKPLDGPILIYGAGGKGQQIANFLQPRGYNLLGFADGKPQQDDRHNGLPVKQIAAWMSEIDPSTTTLLVAIHNHLTSVANLLKTLSGYGFHRTVTPIEFHEIFAGLVADHYWLTSTKTYRDRESDFTFLKSLFFDEASKDLLDRIIQFRLTGDYQCLPPPSTADQYCPDDLPRWPDPIRFVDCGAYNGDTIRSFEAKGYSFTAVAAFEPDYKNFRQLARSVAHISSAICFPCGVGATTCLDRFDARGDMAGQVSADSDTFVQCVALDEALPGFKPTLIKMDIEGSELNALRGAKSIICTSNSALAISAYHRPSDLWEIPKLLVSWGQDYNYYLRCHGHNSFDLVLYVLPNCYTDQQSTA